MGFWKRLGNLFKGIGLAKVGEAEAANPEAMLAAEDQRMREAEAQFNKGLADSAGDINLIKGVITKETAENERRGARIKTLLGLTGTPEQVAENKAKAKVLADEYQQAQARITDAQTRLARSEEKFKEWTKRRNTFVADSKNRLTALQGKIGQAKMAEAEAKLATLSSSHLFDPDAGNLGHINDALDKRIAVAEGTTRVATEAEASNPWAESEAEINARQDAALDNVSALLGIGGDAPKAS